MVAFMRQQNQQVWNKPLPETSSEANSAEGSSNITLWLQPAAQSRVHLCLKIATKAEITNNKDLYSAAETWTIKLIQKINSLPHSVWLMEPLHLLLAVRGKNWHEEQFKIRPLCLTKTLRQTFSQAPSARQRDSLISELGEHHLQLVVSALLSRLWAALTAPSLSPATSISHWAIWERQWSMKISKPGRDQETFWLDAMCFLKIRVPSFKKQTFHPIIPVTEAEHRTVENVIDFCPI